jgi:hypothetical protein
MKKFYGILSKSFIEKIGYAIYRNLLEKAPDQLSFHNKLEQVFIEKVGYAEYRLLFFS